MSPQSVVAILDRPTPRSFGMLGTVTRREDGGLETSGVLGGPPSIISDAELNDLVSGGHARRIPEVVSDDSPLVALWLGDTFAEESARFGLRAPPVSGPGATSVSDATVWVARPRFVWRILDSWLVQAYRKIVRDPRSGIADLMMQVFPDRLESRAARWLTVAEASRDRELEWWQQLERGNGRTRTTAELARDISHSIASARAQPSAVVGFGAEAKAGDKEIAQLVASDLRVANLSFGAWLKDRATARGERTDRRHLQQRGQEMISKYGELAFCLEVLDPLPEFSSLSFVIEGIRHPKILESLTSLAGADRFIFAFVTRDITERLQLLEQEGLSGAALQEVVHDSTETQIPQLRDRASIRVDGANAITAAEQVLQTVLR